MAFIDVISTEKAESPLREIYEDVIKKRGKLSNVLQIHSVNPESMSKHLELYMTVMFGRSPLKRYQREMIAVVVSAANNCEYCWVHHGAALNHFWKDPDKVKQLQKDFREVEVSEADKLLCEFAYDLTKNPMEFPRNKHIEPLKAAGFDDRTIHDANLVIAYFNFVNRTVLGLGIPMDTDLGEGYYYD